MSPTGVYARKAKGVVPRASAPAAEPIHAVTETMPDTKHNVTLPAEIEARVLRAAQADDRTPATYLRRFIINNIDVIDPPTEEA